jgi:hypothetical protein
VDLLVADLKLQGAWQQREADLQALIDQFGVEAFREWSLISENMAVKEPHISRYYPGRDEVCRRYWPDEKTVFDFGCGWGGMLERWPEQTKVVCVDMAPMLEITKHNVARFGLDSSRFQFVLPEEANTLDVSGMYFYASHSLTETSLEIWEYYLTQILPKCAGCYIIGFRGWHDPYVERWPWERLDEIFEQQLFVDPLESGQKQVVEYVGNR